MKKVLGILGLALVMTGCSLGNMDNTPTKKVETYLNNYQTLDSNVLTEIDALVDQEELFDEDQKVTYRDIMKKHYQDLTYTIKEETINGYTIIDDNAHHPTEIEVTIDAVRQKYPDKEIVAVFLPNTYSRTEALFDDFVRVLKKPDKSYVMDIYCDRERLEEYPNINSDLLIEQIPNSEKVSVDTVEKLLKHQDSVLCFMSCTNIYIILDKFKEQIM